MSDPVVSLSNVSFGFGDLTIVEDVSLSIEPGELVAIVGPNGSGKTTFLELLAELRSPDSGDISLRGTERDVAYLPQSPSFRPGFTAGETVRFYATLADASGDPETYLDQVGLGGATERPIEALSGGMTRLLGLAQALVGDPPLVALDEPTSGLDPEMADHVFATTADIAAGDRALIVSSHDMTAVEREADRVLLLADGAIRLDGSPHELIERADASDLREVFSSVVRKTGDGESIRPGKTDSEANGETDSEKTPKSNSEQQASTEAEVGGQ